MIEIQKEYLKELEKHKAQFSAKKPTIQRDEQVLQIEGLKPYTKKFPDNKEGTDSAIKKLQQKIEKEESI